jgi:hypothetical protein
MRILQPVIWAKGTFLLSPQHLQVQDRFVESVLQFRMEALQFRPWGFSRLRINQEALASGEPSPSMRPRACSRWPPVRHARLRPRAAGEAAGAYFEPGQTSSTSFWPSPISA